MINRLNDQESEENHLKSIALKTATQKIDQDLSDCNDSLNHLTRKFNKFLKKNSRDKAQPSNGYNTKKIIEFNYANYTCFECGKQRHIKVECPNIVSKEKGVEDEALMIPNPRRMLKAGLLLVGLLSCVFRIC